MSKIRSSLSRMPKPVKILLWVLIAVLAYALPLLEPPFITTPGVDFGGVLFVVTMYMLVALGLNIVVGYAGLLDLGYVGFYAVGAYTAAILTSFHANWPLLLALPVGVLASTISGVLLGAPTLRVRGDYLEACLTLGRQVRVSLPGGDELTGEATDVDDTGRLVVAGTPVAAGDVLHVRPAQVS